MIPPGYRSALDIRKTEIAIKLIKDTFERELARALHLERVSAPLFVSGDSGLNDNLNGVERPVSFDIPDVGVQHAEIVHSLAKWKRLALRRYGFEPGCGLYTDMNAIRRDEALDNLHSVYVDQWDWEKVITRQDRTMTYLQNTVKTIVGVLADTSDKLSAAFPGMGFPVKRDVYFLTSQELEDRYPELEPKAREDAVCREHKVVFVSQIGGVLKSGKKHDGRAPDYDDWELNGDILIYNPLLDSAFEISSMGIRVDEQSLIRQLELAGCPERAKMPFHKKLLASELPLTIGGGIGQSRICMLLLQKAHIGEVQASIWGAEMREKCAAANIHLL